MKKPRSTSWLQVIFDLTPNDRFHDRSCRAREKPALSRRLQRLLVAAALALVFSASFGGVESPSTSARFTGSKKAGAGISHDNQSEPCKPIRAF
jgi:hypothetical protein